MVLVDTSIWADHFRSGEERLAALLRSGSVAMHPFVLGELALGNLHDRQRTIAMLDALPAAAVISHRDMLDLVDRRSLAGTGIGLVDAHLLATCAAQDLPLWTRDKRLSRCAEAVGLAWSG